MVFFFLPLYFFLSVLESRRTCFFLCKTAATLQNCHHQSKGFKGSNKQFHGWLFSTSPTLFPSAPCVIASFPRSPAPTTTRRLHLPSSLLPFDSATADKKSLSVPSHLFISADLPVFFNVNTAQTGFPIPHSEAAHTSRCGTRGVKDMTSLA